MILLYVLSDFCFLFFTGKFLFPSPVYTDLPESWQRINKLMQIRKNKMILRSACHLFIPIVSTDERKKKSQTPK
jgi:hypothetical protein